MGAPSARETGQGRGPHPDPSGWNRQGQLDLPASGSNEPSNLPIARTPDIDRLLAADAVVAIGVSGGKDSAAVAIAVDRYLRAIGHTGPKVLIHADLGRIEWKDSLPACQRLADHIGWDLMVVRRRAGDLLDRWEGRWTNNVARYAALECVQVILPWSTPGMRFCSSELKTKVIASVLAKRFPDHPILNAIGIRRQESAGRRGKPVGMVDTNLTKRTREAFVWNPIIEWHVDQVWRTIADSGFDGHEAYRVYGSSRVSCVFCIMSSLDDLRAAASCTDNHAIYRKLVDLEIRSSFGFQGHRWLADTAPGLLDPSTRKAVKNAKLASRERMQLEARLPPHLLYVKGWPVAVPNLEDADLLASTRRQIASLLQINVGYLTGAGVRERYRELLAGQTMRTGHHLAPS